MKGQTYQVKIPGKLMIAGEYAVLEPGRKAIVVSVDRYITAVIEQSDKNILSLPQLGLNHVIWETDGDDIQFSISDSKLLFIKNAIRTFNLFIQEKAVNLRPFSLTITSELDDSSGKKYGLGSSAAVVVAVISSMYEFYKNEIGEPSLDSIFKLSSIAHFKTQGSGSCADIAASTYRGWVYYASFDSSWLIDKLNSETPINKIVGLPWPDLIIKSLTPPTGLELCVGWTGKEVATAKMIDKIAELRRNQPSLYTQFLRESEEAVERLIESFKNNDSQLAISSLAKNRKALMKLSDFAGISIESTKLKELIRIADKYGSGKTSGSGGGDCGIAFITDLKHIKLVYNEWKEEDIQPLRLSVSKIN